MKLRSHQKKGFVLTALVLLVLLFVTQPRPTFISHVYYYLHPKESIQCYHVKDRPTLPDIGRASPQPGKSIFFHETSCNSYFSGKITISARQACAVESAANLNPNYGIYLLIASPGVIKFEGTESDRILRVLMELSNVHINHVDYDTYTKGTPVEDLYRQGKIDDSGYAQSHASDVLRYLTLWKYGGIYLDLDVIITRSLEDLPPNFAGSESDNNVAAGVIGFGSSGAGNEFALRCLEDLKDNFKGHSWGYNGPGVITRMLRDLCNVHYAKDMLNKDCEGFKVYPQGAFYPISWWNWTMYFDENFRKETLTLSKDSFAIHVWNKHSVHTKLPIKSKAAYAEFARTYCPRVFGECEEFF